MSPPPSNAVTSRYKAMELQRLESAASRRGLTVGEYQKCLTLGITMRGHIDSAFERYQSYKVDHLAREGRHGKHLDIEAEAGA
jgi:hypothetical protein